MATNVLDLILLLLCLKPIWWITKEWWVDIGAARHLCSDRKMLFSYVQINERELYMGNSVTSKIEGIEKMILKPISTKKISV